MTPPWIGIVQLGQTADERQLLPGREDARVEALRLAPVGLALEDQIGEEEPGDVVEEQGREDLVRLEERPQDARDQCPGGAPETTHHDHRGDHERRGAARAAEVEAGGGAGDRTDVHLPLGADVEELHPEGRGRGQPGEGERRRDDQGLVERAGLEERRIEQLAVGRERVVAGREQHDRGDEEREHDRGDGHRDREPPRLAQPPFKRETHSVPSSRLGVKGRTRRGGAPTRAPPRTQPPNPWRCRPRP